MKYFECFGPLAVHTIRKKKWNVFWMFLAVRWPTMPKVVATCGWLWVDKSVHAFCFFYLPVVLGAQVGVPWLGKRTRQDHDPRSVRFCVHLGARAEKKKKNTHTPNKTIRYEKIIRSNNTWRTCWKKNTQTHTHTPTKTVRHKIIPSTSYIGVLPGTSVLYYTTAQLTVHYFSTVH